jgi:hypothetical protein
MRTHNIPAAFCAIVFCLAFLPIAAVLQACHLLP